MSGESTIVEIPLRRRDGSVRAWVKVDSEDAPKLTCHQWCLGSHGYAKRNQRSGQSSIAELLHRKIMGLDHGDPRHVDHINGDRLDCRKANMRIVTQSENMQNQTRLRTNNQSGYRGVWWDESRQKWEAYARVNGRRHHLGRYETAEDADRAARKFRELNMPCSPEATRSATSAQPGAGQEFAGDG